MTIPLSKRLRVCAGFVAKGDRVADIGCDHGYLGIYLLKNSIAASVIASDINEMPLKSAQTNADRFGVGKNISFYLSDGARNIPHNFDTLVCAGMGADTMISILEASPWLQSSQYRLILQCQSKTPALRKYLSHLGWWIKKEAVVRDGRFLYTVMEVLWKPDAPRLTVGQYYFPPALLAEPSGELPAYYAQLRRRLQRAVDSRGEQADPDMLQALKELDEDTNLTWLKENANDNG